MPRTKTEKRPREVDDISGRSDNSNSDSESSDDQGLDAVLLRSMHGKLNDEEKKVGT
jgi:hypothetical protein